MLELINETIKLIKEIVSERKFQVKHKRSSKDFIRKRKLSFDSVIFFVLGLSNTTFDFERIKFCEISNIGRISNAALSKARDKINFTAFRELLEKTQKLIIQKISFKGYDVIAVDGMKGELPNTKEFMEKYRPTKKSNYPLFHAVFF